MNIMPCKTFLQKEHPPPPPPKKKTKRKKYMHFLNRFHMVQDKVHKMAEKCMHCRGTSFVKYATLCSSFCTRIVSWWTNLETPKIVRTPCTLLWRCGLVWGKRLLGRTLGGSLRWLFKTSLLLLDSSTDIGVLLGLREREGGGERKGRRGEEVWG